MTIKQPVIKNTFIPQTLKGFRDFLPDKMRVRQKAIGILRKTFVSFGFEPLETPALEYAETLLNKYGEDADKLVYTFLDNGNRRVGLRYDLTVPTSRVLAQYRDKIKLPFKRYQIQPVWRAEKPQRGRYREFIQCDIDIFGSSSALADAEIAAVICESLKNLGFKEYLVRINSRQVLFSLMEKVGIKDNEQRLIVLRAIDKLDKKAEAEVREELAQKGFNKDIVNNIFKELQKAKPDDNLAEVLKLIEYFGVDKKFFCFDPRMVRGLDYYTGPIFETVVEKPKIGSITGGGRYDNLISQLGGPAIPATGTTIGLERICDVILELGLWNKEKGTDINFLVTVFNNDLVAESLKILQLLRENLLSVDIYIDSGISLKKQLDYAYQKGIPYALIIGPDEVEKKTITVRNIKTGEQKTLDQENMIKLLTQ